PHHVHRNKPMALSRGALLLLLGLGCAPLYPALAQRDSSATPDSTSLVGQVVDRHSHEPIHGGQVVVVGTRMIATTDSSGHFVLSPVTPGTYALEVRAVGYTPVTWLATTEARHVLR